MDNECKRDVTRPALAKCCVAHEPYEVAYPLNILQHRKRMRKDNGEGNEDEYGTSASEIRPPQRRKKNTWKTANYEAER
jgi:hypothetical protein